MKKHFYSFVLVIALLAMTGSLNPIYAQKYCKPTFSNGGCNGLDLAGIAITQGSNSIFSSSPSCVTSGYDTSGVSGAGITLYRGKTYNFTVNGDGLASFGVYIDYQHDGSFEDLGDFVADDNNGSYQTVTESITIPLTASPKVTRMRVIAAPGMNAISPTTDCATWATGSCQDYKVTITAYANDVDILALNPEYCPNKKEPVQVIMQNTGLNNLTNIPFVFKVGSTTVNATYSRTLASNTSDTFTIGTFDASVAATYNLVVYANLINDADRTNDTIKASLHIAQPLTPTVTANINHCGPGSPYINAKSNTPKTFTYWYTTDTGQVPLYKGRDSIQTPYMPIGSTVTYYVQSVFNTNDTLTKGVFSTARSNYGNMFDVFAKNQVIVDSLAVNLSETTTDSVGVWYRVGTRSGYELDQSAWTHIATVLVHCAGAGNPTIVRLPYPVTLQTGTNYGFYTYPQGGDVCTYDLTYQSDNPRANGDMSINAGCSLGGEPFTGAVTNGRDWAGRFYYHLNACPSPRVSTTLTMIQNPNGAYLAKTAPFQGKYNLGDEVHADQVCAGDTLTYTIMPPTGMNESDYGAKWVVNSIKISTVRGTTLPNSKVTMPTAGAPGVIQVYPTAAYGDSDFVMSVDMKTPATGCDSVIQRYLTISANPVANFSFTNPCGNQSVLITDLSSVKSTVDTIRTWLWDFGDSSTTNLARKNPYPHLYAHPGTYTVSLNITSTPGCPATFSKTLVEYPVPVAKFGNKLPCNKQAISYIDSSTIASGASNVAWSWSFGDGTTSAIENPAHTYPKSGPYSVKLVTTSNQGCKDSLTKTVRVQPLPIPIFSYNNACVGAAIYMSASKTIDTNLVGKLPTLKWNYGDGSGTTTTSSHTYANNGTFTITLTATSGDGCIADTTKTITPYTQPVPKITYKSACVGQPVSFVDSSGTGNSGVYSWTFGDGGSANNIDSASVNYAYSKTGTFTVGLSIVSGQGCTGSGSAVILIPGYPIAGFTANNVCVGTATVFKNTSTGVTSPGGGYTWNFGDTTSSNLPGPTHTYAYVGQDSVKLIATNKYGCADSTSLVVSVNPYPVIGKWTTKVHNLTFQFTPANKNIGNFVWHFGDAGNDSSALASPTFTYPPSASGKYQVVKLYVTNSFGCTSERTDSVLGTTNGIEVEGTAIDGITVYPNPFEGTTNINYTLPTKSDVKISVYDAEGKLVAKLKDGTFGAGTYTDAFDANKYRAAEGVYYLRMYINNMYYTTKIVNVK